MPPDAKAFKLIIFARLRTHMDENKRCEVEIMPDEKLGWVIKPKPGCEAVFEEIAKMQGPHSQRYLNVRKKEQTREIPEEGDTQSQQ